IQGFGNRYMDLTNAEIKAMIQYQIGALEGVIGKQVQFVKCHGALYNRAIIDESLSKGIVEGIEEYREGLKIVVPPYSALEHVVKINEAPYLLEGFADRMYKKNGELVNRKEPNAMITDPDQI